MASITEDVKDESITATEERGHGKGHGHGRDTEYDEESRHDGESRHGGGKSHGSSYKNNYEIDYSDSRFTDVEAEKKNALAEVEQTYDSMIDQSDSFYTDQINAAKEWEKKQTELQNEQTDFAIEQIEQQKEQEEKDYQDEQSGAYVDWQKQSNKYGADAEQEAATGMSGTGYSESAQVSMYNAYQQRLSKARESFKTAIQNYNNSITQARLQNSSALAQIAYQSLQQQLELALQGFQYKNQLLLDKAEKKLTVDNMYYQRWQDVLTQMNTENALAEQIRQFNESLEEEQRQFDAQYGTATASYSGGSGSSSGGSVSGRELTLMEKTNQLVHAGASTKEVTGYLEGAYSKGEIDGFELQGLLSVYT